MAVPVIRASGVTKTFTVDPASLGFLVTVVSGSPTAWEWNAAGTPLQRADIAGVNGDFTEGHAVGVNPSFYCPMPGGYTFTVRAQNSDGWSQTIFVCMEAQTGTILRGPTDADAALVAAAAAQSTATSSLNADLVSKLATLDPSVNPCTSVAGPQGGLFRGVLVAGGPAVDSINVFASSNALWRWQRDDTARLLDTRHSGASTTGADATAAVQACFNLRRALIVPEVGHLVQIVPATWYASLVGADRRLSKLYQTDPTKSIIAPAVSGGCQPPSVRHLWFDGGLHGLVIDNANNDEQVHNVSDCMFRQQVGTGLRVVNSPSSLIRVVGSVFETGDANNALAVYSDANYTTVVDNWLALRGQYGVETGYGGNLTMERTVGVPLYGTFKHGAWVKHGGIAARLSNNRFGSDDVSGRPVIEVNSADQNTVLAIRDNLISTWDFAFKLFALPANIHIANNLSYGDGLGGLGGALAHGKGLWIDPAATADYVRHGRVWIDDAQCFWTNSARARGLILCPPQSYWHDNSTITLDDGVNAPTTFETQVTGGFVATGGGVVVVDLSAAADGTAAATAWAAAISGVGAGLAITATSYTTIVILENDAAGVAGNVLMTGTCATLDGYYLNGMAAGADAGHQELPNLLHGRNESPQSCQAARDLKWADVLVSQNCITAFPNTPAPDGYTVSDTVAYDHLNGVACRQVTATRDGVQFLMYQAGAGWLARAATLGHTYTAVVDLVIEGAVAPVTVMLEFYGQQRWFTLGNGTHVINCPTTPYTGAAASWYAYLYQMSSGTVVRFGRLRVVDGKRELHDVNTTVKDTFGATDPVDVTYVWHASGDRWIIQNTVRGSSPERIRGALDHGSVNGGWDLATASLPPHVKEIDIAGLNFAGYVAGGVTPPTITVTNGSGPDGEPVLNLLDASAGANQIAYRNGVTTPSLPTNCLYHITGNVRAIAGTHANVQLILLNDPGGAEQLTDSIMGSARTINGEWRPYHWTFQGARAAHTVVQVWIFPTDGTGTSTGEAEFTNMRLWQEIIA